MSFGDKKKIEMNFIVMIGYFMLVLKKNMVSMYFQKLHEINENLQFTQDHFQLTYFKVIYCTFFAS